MASINIGTVRKGELKIEIEKRDRVSIWRVVTVTFFWGNRSDAVAVCADQPIMHWLACYGWKAHWLESGRAPARSHHEAKGNDQSYREP